MNLLLLQKSDWIEAGVARVEGRRLRHLREVLRASPGDVVRAGEIDGLVGQATIRSIDESHAILQARFDREPPSPTDVRVALAMPRPKSLPRILAALASFGVKEIWLTHALRVEKSYWDCEQIAEDAIRGALVLGLEQGRDVRLPRVQLRRRLKPFVEDEVPTLAGGRRAFVAHPEGDVELPGPSRAPAFVAIGPEGGFVPYEIELWKAAGLRCARLGDRPLRTETAVAAALGRLWT